MKRIIWGCLLLTSCNLSDVTDALPHGYFFNAEGKYDNGISKSLLVDKVVKIIRIPTFITAYKYDDEYLIARQLPVLHDHDTLVMNDRPDSQTVHFWIIKFSTDSLYGPLDSTHYLATKAKMGIHLDL